MPSLPPILYSKPQTPCGDTIPFVPPPYPFNDNVFQLLFGSSHLFRETYPGLEGLCRFLSPRAIMALQMNFLQHQMAQERDETTRCRYQNAIMALEQFENEMQILGASPMSLRPDEVRNFIAEMGVRFAAGAHEQGRDFLQYYKNTWHVAFPITAMAILRASDMPFIRISEEFFPGWWEAFAPDPTMPFPE